LAPSSEWKEKKMRRRAAAAAAGSGSISRRGESRRTRDVRQPTDRVTRAWGRLRRRRPSSPPQGGRRRVREEEAAAAAAAIAAAGGDCSVGGPVGGHPREQSLG